MESTIEKPNRNVGYINKLFRFNENISDARRIFIKFGSLLSMIIMKIVLELN